MLVIMEASCYITCALIRLTSAAHLLNFPPVIILEQRQVSGSAVIVIVGDIIRESNSTPARTDDFVKIH